MLSEIIYKRTYSREGENWVDTIERVCKGLKVLGWYGDDLLELKDFMLKRKGLVSGRALWQLGASVYGDSLQNCWCVKVNNLDSFLFTFNELMLGGGVGFNIQAENIYELPRVKFNPKVTVTKNNDCSFIVPDNREGWIELLKRVLDSFFYGGKDFNYSVEQIRRAGEKIKTFGGIASGPEALITGIAEITKVLSSRYDKKLRPINCLDIKNIIGVVVVSGNVRRASEIAIGDACDTEFINAKQWPYPNHRSMSNNAVACETLDDFCGWHTFESDPIGFVNLKNLRRFGRLADGVDYRYDSRIIGCNPCGEIGLEDREPCTLAEIYLPKVTMTEFKRLSYLLLKAVKLITRAEFHDPITQEVVNRNRRVGIGLAGLAQSNISWNSLTNIYRFLEKSDKEISSKLGINESIKLTTIKPGGTMCLMAGVTPGMSDAVGEYVIRRVRFSSNDLLLDKLKWAGYNIEPQLNLDGSIDVNTSVVSFPLHYKNARVGSSVTDLLNIQLNLQTYWADNCVSVSHGYDKKDIGIIKEWMEKYYNECIKTTCFSPNVTGFKQMPIEAISKKRFNELSLEVKDFEVEAGNDIEIECEKDSCPVK